MKVTFLGTGTSQGIPIIGSNHPVCLSKNVKDKRLRSSILIEENNNTIIIDCGPDFRQQMLKNTPKKIDGIIFTHEHSDHTAGLDDIRPFYFKQGDINLFGEANVFESLKQRFAYIFETKNRYPGAPSVCLNTINNNSAFTINETEIIPIRVMHNQLPILGFRINDFVYLTDVKSIPEEEFSKLQNINTLVISALRIKEHASHLNLNEALTMVAKINPKQTYFTHISHLLGFHDEVNKNLPNNINLAYDNLTITL